VRRTRTIDAAPGAVWAVISDPHHLPRWWPALQRVEDASPAAWTKVLVSPKGKPVRADFTRVGSEPERRLVWRQEVSESPFERILRAAETEISLEPARDGRTQVALTATERLRGLARFGAPMVRRAARRRLDSALDGLERITSAPVER
jgi:uncharacterized protein YndB with AHSA1/START domain